MQAPLDVESMGLALFAMPLFESTFFVLFD